MYTAVTITQITPFELENLIEKVVEKVVKKSLETSTKEKPKLIKDHVTKREAAFELSCSVPMIDKLIQQGRLDKVKVGAKVLIPREGIERILNNKKGSVNAK